MLKMTRKRGLILGGIILVAAIGTLTMTGESVEVNGLVAGPGQVEKYVEESGIVKSKGARYVYATKGGEVAVIHVEPGDAVTAGELLVSLGDQEVALSYLALESRKTALEKALEELSKPADPERLAIIRGDITTAKNARDLALKAYEDGKLIFASGALSQDQLALLKSAYDQSVTALRQLEDTYGLASKGSSKEVIEQTQAELSALNYELQLLNLNKDSMGIYAPMGGTVVDKVVELGQVLAPGSPIIEIADLSQCYIEVELLATDAQSLQVGASAEVFVDEGGGVVRGVVERIYPKAYGKLSDLGVEQKRIKLDIALESQLPLTYGMEVDVRLIEAVAEAAISLPESAIFELDGKPHVFVVEDQKMKLQSIVIGLEGNKVTEIISGLVDGQIVVDTPDSKRAVGDKVKVILQSE